MSRENFMHLLRPGLFSLLAGLCLGLASLTAHAQMPMRPPMFMGGIPGMAQMQSIELSRHQARTLLYREALEELRRNPKAADMQDCDAPGASPRLCIPKAGAPLVPALQQPQPIAPSTTTAVPADIQAPAGPLAVTEPAPPLIQRKRALLIGNNDYPQPIPALFTPVHDVEKIGQLLRREFAYDVRIVRNASKAEIVSALQAIAADSSKDDSVLVMYAGHGYLMNDIDMGFWIPVDGSVKTAGNWISNSDISKFLKAIPAKQLILVSDSCFSGSLTREQKITDANRLGKQEIMRQRTVLVLSSGGDEPVSDEGKDGHSIFAWSLINTLNGLDKEAMGFEVFRVVKSEVSKAYPQEPQYGAVISAGHAPGGDYWLEKVN